MRYRFRPGIQSHHPAGSLLLMGLLVVFTLPAFGQKLKDKGKREPVAELTIVAPLTTKNCRSEESNLADVIADALRDADKADAAFLTASSFNANTTIPKGGASIEDVLKALEYPDDTIVIVKLTGAKIRRGLEHALSLYPQGNSAFLQVSGMTVTINPDGDKGNRITSVKIGRSDLADTKTYRIAMPSPLASGSVGYYKIWEKGDIERDTNVAVTQAVRDYLATQRTLGGKSEERLVFKK